MPILRDEVLNQRKSLDGRCLYQCDSCGKVAPWSDEWAWYGSYKQKEDFGLKGVEDIVTICSNDCRIALVAAGKLPSEGLRDNGSIISD